MRSILLISALVWVYSVAAQFDMGGSGGPSWKTFMPRQGDPHATASFMVDATGWTANLFYREQLDRRFNLGIDLGWSRQSLYTDYYSGSHAGGSGGEMAVVLHTIDVAILPEWRLTPSGEYFLRSGISAGFRVASTMKGYGRDMDPQPKDFGGEIRALVGFGIRIQAGDRDAIVLDPYTAFGLSSMLKVPPGSRSWEVGFRLGWCWLVKEGALSQWIRPNTTTSSRGSNR